MPATNSNPALNFILLAVALLLSAVLLPVGVIFTIVRCLQLWSWKKAVGYATAMAFSVAVGLDVLGNVVCRDFFNAVMLQSGGYGFGNQHETISRVLGINKQKQTLTDAGRALANLLNFIDPGHVEKAANNNITPASG